MCELVKLNVGGRIFYTTRTTLRNQKSFYFERLLRTDFTPLLIDDAIFIDRDSDEFVHIMRFFREGVLPYPISPKLKAELDFYQFDGFITKKTYDVLADVGRNVHALRNAVLIELVQLGYDAYTIQEWIGYID
jgi:hypothetical protein